MRLISLWLLFVLQTAIVVAGCADAPGDSNSGGSGGNGGATGGTDVIVTIIIE